MTKSEKVEYLKKGVPNFKNLALTGEAKLQAEFKEAVRFTNKKMKELSVAIALQDDEVIKKLVDILLRHKKPLFDSAVKVNSRLPPHRQSTMMECLYIAKLMDFSEPLPEWVIIHLFEKKNGDYRKVHDHGIRHRTAQHAIARVLGKFLKPRPFQYSRKGVHRAIYKAVELIKCGHFYYARLDVKEFFQNFSVSALMNELPLPFDVVANAVVGQHMKVCFGYGSNATKLYDSGLILPTEFKHLNQARLGIPTGSSTSSIISEMTISRLDMLDIEGVAVINYADDFLVLATDLPLLAQGVRKLTKAVEKLQDGQFTLVQKEEGTIFTGATFLGHVIQFKFPQPEPEDDTSEWHSKPLEVTVKPYEGSLEKIYHEVNKIEEKFQELLGLSCKEKSNEFLELVAIYYARVQGYRSAYKACTELETRYITDIIIALLKKFTEFGFTEQQVTAAIKPWMRHLNYPYMFKD